MSRNHSIKYLQAAQEAERRRQKENDRHNAAALNVQWRNNNIWCEDLFILRIICGWLVSRRNQTTEEKMTEEEDDDDENPCRMHNAIRTMSTNVVKQQTESERRLMTFVIRWKFAFIQQRNHINSAKSDIDCACHREQINYYNLVFLLPRRAPMECSRGSGRDKLLRRHDFWWLSIK